MNRRSWLICALMLLASAPVRLQSLTFDATTVGAPGTSAPAELFMPAGAVPSAAVILLHGCSGVGPHYR